VLCLPRRKSAARQAVCFYQGKQQKHYSYSANLPLRNHGAAAARVAEREVLLTFISIDKSKPGALPGQRSK